MLKRTLFFTSPILLSLKNKQLIGKTKEDPETSKSVPIEDISCIIIEDQQVYRRHCGSKESRDVHIKRVRKLLPPSGQISILSVTDKQYGEIMNYWGQIEQIGRAHV